MSIETDQQELDAVNAAIEAILSGGQAFARGDNSVRNADYAQLCARRDVLTARIERATRGGIRVRQVTPL